jgi:transcription antitermination factor NusG
MEKMKSDLPYFWHAVYVKSRAEKRAKAELEFKNIETFLPLQRKLREWSDRKKWVEMPLISGYLFVFVSRKEYDLVLQSNYVVSYVRFEGKAAIIPENQIEYLRLLLQQTESEIEITKEPLKPGQMIEIVSGPFIGLKGKLIKVKGKSKLAIELEQLGYAALVEIVASNIVPWKEVVKSES